MKALCFFIGTEAELIKVFPVIQEASRRNLPIRIIASGQNGIDNSKVLATIGYKPDLLLSDESKIVKSASGLFAWFIQNLSNAAKRISNVFSDVDFHQSIMVIHGDTISTVMGAWIGKKLGMTVAHIEAGLRSKNLFDPFPEELDRIIASRWTRLHFAPGTIACENLKKAKGSVIDTGYNTVIDSLAFSRKISCDDAEVKSVLGKDYFVFVLHRQENLMKPALVREITQQILEIAEGKLCVFLLHKPTEVALKAMGLLEKIERSKNVITMRRKDYFDFMKLLENASYIITDGGSNQEELSYMGKPCLILRKRTERTDGLGENAMLYGGEMDAIGAFSREYASYARDRIVPDRFPSGIIMDTLERELEKHYG